MNFSEIKDILIYNKNIVSLFYEDMCLWKRKKPDIYIVNLLKPANSSNWSVTGLTNPIDNPYGRSLPNEESKYTGLETTAQKSKVEGQYISKDTIHLIKGHTYYLRWTQISATVNYSRVTYDCYSPIAEPSIVRKASTLYISDTDGKAQSYSSAPNLLPCMSNNAYQMNTLIVTIPDETGDYHIRFDVNNNNYGFQTNFCCPMLIDLTETYTNKDLDIPSLSIMNTRNYFEGTINLNEWERPVQPNNEIWYTSTDDNIVSLYETSDFDANVISNTYKDGKGVIKFDNDITKIGGYAFDNCSTLLSISIPNSVTSIGMVSFFYCTSLTSITLSSNVTNIGASAFFYCPELTSVICQSTVPPTGGELMFNLNMFSTDGCPIYVPSESVNSYKTATNWSTYANRIQAIQ